MLSRSLHAALPWLREFLLPPSPQLRCCLLPACPAFQLPLLVQSIPCSRNCSSHGVSPCSTFAPSHSPPTTFKQLNIDVGGTLKINLLDVDAEVDVRNGENLEEIQLKAWWKQSLDTTNGDSFDIVTSNNIVSLNIQDNEAKSLLLQLQTVMPARWCNLILHAGKRPVEIQNLREASLTVKTTGGDVTLGELRGNEALIQSNGGSVMAGLVSAILDLKTGGGNLCMKKALGTTMQMDTGGGDVVIGYAYGEDVKLVSGGGAVEINHLQAQGMAYVSSTGGNVKIDGLDGNAKILSGGGTVQLQLLTNAKEVQIDAGAGDVILYVTSKDNTKVEHVGSGKCSHEERVSDFNGLCIFSKEDLEMETKQKPGHLNCRVLISGSGNVITRERSWLEAVMHRFPPEMEQEREQFGWLFKICSREMFLVFEMSLDVEAIIVPRDAQYEVVLNSVTEERWILILQTTDEAVAGLEFPSHLWLRELFYAIDLIPEYEFF